MMMIIIKILNYKTSRLSMYLVKFRSSNSPTSNHILKHTPYPENNCHYLQKSNCHNDIYYIITAADGCFKPVTTSGVTSHYNVLVIIRASNYCHDN